ncbi:MAG TPA: hypothetical protein VFX30_14560 [bacterium]|nr:hypothetical protein [bacterium]
MNRYKHLLIHGICATLMTVLQFRFGFISQETIGSGILSSPDLTWETIHHFMANAFFVFFLVIPLGFILQYAYFRILCREPLANTYSDRDASLSSLYVSAALMAVFLLSFLPPAHAEDPKASKALALYGVEILRQPMIGVEEFEDYAKKNPQAGSVLWKYPGVQYKGTGNVVLAGYFLDRKQAEARKDALGGGSKILDITVDPFFAAGRKPVFLYRFPKGGDEDMVRGDVWIRSGGRDRLLERDVLLGYYDPANTTVFKATGLSKEGHELLYCRGGCFRYNLKTDQKVADPHLKIPVPGH